MVDLFKAKIPKFMGKISKKFKAKQIPKFIGKVS